jgi:hypothetical protein
MANQEHPSGGYLVEATQLLPLLPHEVQDEFDMYVADLDCEDALKLLRRHWPATLPPVESIFVFGPEDTSEDFSEGSVVALFNESDLYTKTPTNQARQLVKAGVQMPSYYNWTMFG